MRVLSIVGLSVLLYGIIEAPQEGWTDPKIARAASWSASSCSGSSCGGSRAATHPMLDVRFFKNPRFTAASMSIMFVFFAMFGGSFLLTQ